MTIGLYFFHSAPIHGWKSQEDVMKIGIHKQDKPKDIILFSGKYHDYPIPDLPDNLRIAPRYELPVQ